MGSMAWAHHCLCLFVRVNGHFLGRTLFLTSCKLLHVFSMSVVDGSRQLVITGGEKKNPGKCTFNGLELRNDIFHFVELFLGIFNAPV